MKSENIYHERQTGWLCGLHTINNMLQSNTYDKQQLDKMCAELTPNYCFFLNPHKSLIFGYYDANVIFYALAKHGLEFEWQDRRNDLNDENLEAQNLRGLILNMRGRGILGRCFGQRHWMTILRKDGFFYNLDSKQNSYSKMSSNETFTYLKRLQKETDVEIIYICTS